jgi:predicted alpha/beta hydrolase family esterase
MNRRLSQEPGFLDYQSREKYMMKKFVLISPVVDKYEASIATVVSTDKSHLVIVGHSLAQFFCRRSREIVGFMLFANCA